MPETPEAASPSRPTPQKDVLLPLVLFVLVALLAIFIRLRLLSVPLERDEGEYAYMGQLIRQGLAPYREAYNMKWPGTYLVYAVLMSLLGETDTGIHLGLIFVNALQTWALVVLVRRCFGPAPALWAGAVFLAWSLTPAVLGTVAHATQFLVLFAIPGCTFLLRGLDSRRAADFIPSGLLFGLAMLMKQHAFLFAICAAVAVLAQSRTWGFSKSATLAVCGTVSALVPFLLVLSYYAMTGGLASFWLWTFQYAAAYTKTITPHLAWLDLKWTLSGLSADFPFWLLALAGLACAWRRKWRHSGLLAILLLAALLSAIPGFIFRPHYFVPLIPFASVFAGLAFWQLHITLSTRTPRYATVGSFISFAFLVVFYAGIHAPSFFLLAPDDVSRDFYHERTFPAMRDLGLKVGQLAPPDARVAVFGSEPELYFYARRRAATGFLYTYPLMERQPFANSMQHQMIREIEAHPPQYIVYDKMGVSWMQHPDSDPTIFHWIDIYLQNYIPVTVTYLSRSGDVTLPATPENLNDPSEPTIVLWQRKPVPNPGR